MKFKNYVKKRDHIEEALDQSKLDLAVQQGKVTPEKAKDVAQANKEVEDHLSTMEVAKKVKMYLQPNMIDWLHTRNIDFRHDERPNERINIQKFSGRVENIAKVLEDFTNQKRLWPGASSLLGNDMDRSGGAFGNLFHFLSSLEKQPRPDENQSSKSHFIDKEIVQPLQKLSAALTNYNKMVSETHPELFSHTGMLNYRAMNPNQRVMFKQPPAAPVAKPAAPQPPAEEPEPTKAPTSKGLWGKIFGR